ncbi:MAG: phenylalanine--tRNA ligase subunit beta [Phycisphaerae bacterium]|nr:phenylalanine--tRNA ligase subunit beta [Phycisphaerae bacterium]
MKISLNWLNNYVQAGSDAQKIADTLSNLGLPCESIEKVGNDTVIDVEVTSNRGDCLSHIGIARELAAASGAELKLPDVRLEESEKDIAQFASVEIKEPQLCRRYTARIIGGVKVGPSPKWLKDQLETVGLRSVNNVVDATNYAMMEVGQPPHAFDYKKIAGGKIIVRKAIAGERIVSIDGTKCELKPEMLIIADAERPVAVAGVMGGLDTEVSENTTTILLEDAWFEPVSVRRTGRTLGLASEAAFRFERFVDIENIDWASKRTAELIAKVAGGKVIKGVIDAYPGYEEPKKITLRLSRLNKLLGIEVSAEAAMRILTSLQFAPKQNGDMIYCTAPSWRSDIYRETDLIEEVARCYGYDKIPAGEKIHIKAVSVDPRQKLLQTTRNLLNSCGFYETVNITFADDTTAKLFSGDKELNYLGVKDVSRKNANLLRQNLIGSLLGVLQTNLNAKNSPCRVYEIADTFIPDEKNAQPLPIEKTRIGIACDTDLREVRGAIESLIHGLSPAKQISFAPANLAWAKAGAEIHIDGKVIGTAGVVNDKIRDSFDFKNCQVYAAELDLEQLAPLLEQVRTLQPIPRFPFIERDLSVIVDTGCLWADIMATIKSQCPSQLEDIKFVEVYLGKGIPKGKKSITLSLRFRDDDGTLTHETVNEFEMLIVKNLKDQLCATFRTAG